MNAIRTNLYKRKHRSGSVAWMVRWKDGSTGKWKAITGGKTRSEAAIVESRVRESLLKGEDPNPKLEVRHLKMRDLTHLFYSSAGFVNASKKHQVGLRDYIERSIVPYFSDANVLELNQRQCVSFYLGLKASGLSHATIRKYHFAFLALMDEACEIAPGFINPVRAVGHFSKLFPKQEPTRDLNFLTTEELSAIYLELEKRIIGKRYHSESRDGQLAQVSLGFVKFLANTGMRRSEALSLRWKDIDRPAGFIHIRKSKTGKARTIPLDREAWSAIASLDSSTGFVFTVGGQSPNPEGFLKPLQRAAKAAGINKRVDIHSLRHSFASNKIRQGWGLKKVSTMLGHADITMTSEKYSHLLDGDLKVRDDFRFDNQAQSENSVTGRNNIPLERGRLEDLLSQVIEAAKSLNTQSPETVAVAMRAAHETVRETLGLLASARAESSDLVDSATLMLRSGSAESTGVPVKDPRILNCL